MALIEPLLASESDHVVPCAGLSVTGVVVGSMVMSFTRLTLTVLSTRTKYGTR